MSKTLIIVESPHKAETIQGFLDPKQYIVLASKGHITELAHGGHHGLGVDVERNFKPHYRLTDAGATAVEQLMNVAKSCDNILLCSDNDREGESISWHVNERLKDMGLPTKRATFSEISKPAILKAIKNAGEIDQHIVDAQKARQILDRIVGFTASPFLMNTVGPKLSAGRVQSVVTRMVVDRELEIEAFKPETFFTLEVLLSKDGKTSFLTKFPTTIPDQKEANDMKNRLSGKEYIVSEVISAEEAKLAPAPMITSSLQQYMSRTHSMSADRTMKASQTLYESGMCTYIRTDSVRVSDEAMDDVRKYLTDNKMAISDKPNIFKNEDAAQDAHEAIRPVDVTISSKSISDPDEKLVYDAIWDHFVASQMKPAIFSTLKVTAHVKDDPEVKVKAAGKAIKSMGYMDVLKGNTSMKIDIPSLSKGDVLSLFGNLPVMLQKKQTQPPARYSEANLLKTLEKRKIGRPSTYATLLGTICTRNYVEQKGNVFHATELGKKVTALLKDHFSFMDYDYTSKLEKELDDIASGKVELLSMLNGFYPSFKEQLGKAYVASGNKLCKNCGSPTHTIKMKNGENFIGCTNYPKCKFTSEA